MKTTNKLNSFWCKFAQKAIEFINKEIENEKRRLESNEKSEKDYAKYTNSKMYDYYKQAQVYNKQEIEMYNNMITYFKNTKSAPTWFEIDFENIEKNNLTLQSDKRKHYFSEISKISENDSAFNDRNYRFSFLLNDVFGCFVVKTLAF